MKLRIENLAKIKSAELEFNGITVIVGDNNTGKSTIGKVLYAVFNSMLGFAERIKNDRYQNCRAILRDVLPYMPRRKILTLRQEGDLVTEFLNRKRSDEDFKYMIETIARSRGAQVDSAKLLSELRDVREPTDLMMRNRLIRDYFSSVFNGQYISFLNPLKGALVNLTVKGSNIRVLLRKRATAYNAAVELQHPAYYIDSPNLIHAIGNYGHGMTQLGATLVDAVQEGIRKLADKDRSLVNDVVGDMKLSRIYQKLYSIIDGRLELNEGGELVFRPAKGKRRFDLDIGNMSQGLKSFGLLLAAVRFGALKKRDILILDEPEIHLHPEWQIRYAELIVLIQQAFDLTVLLTSHSADFIQAIRLFAKKHGTFQGVNAYVTESMPSGYVKVNPVSHENWDDVFSRFEGAFNTLMDVEAKLQEDGE